MLKIRTLIAGCALIGLVVFIAASAGQETAGDLVEQGKSKFAPSLLRSTYRASLRGTSLAGDGSWLVHRPSAGPSVLPLPLNLALARVRSEERGKAHTAGNGADAKGEIEEFDPSSVVLAEIDGKNLGLLLLQQGPQTIRFDWSARGSVSPSGLHFDLRLPPCPFANLELELPADHVVSVPRSVALLTGPHEAKTPGKRLWKLSLTGKAQIELDIRPLAGASDLPVSQLVEVESTQEITPDKVMADFKFQIDVPRYPLRELVFDCHPSLSPYEVSLPPRKLDDSPSSLRGQAEIVGWKVEARGASALLKVKLRDPFQGTLAGLQVRCLAQRPAEVPWRSPYLRLQQALTRGEKLKIQVHPDVQVEEWDPGNFRLLSSGTGPGGALILSLIDERTVDPRLPALLPQRPRFLGKTRGVELHAHQQTWWHLGPKGMTLSADIAFEVGRGSVHQLQIKLPKGGKNRRLEKVEVSPASLLQSWSHTDELIVELRGGITPRNPARLLLQFASDWDNPSGPGSTPIDFPDLVPMHAALRDGTFHISVDPVFQASVAKYSVPAAGFPADDGEPMKSPVLFSFPFREVLPNPLAIHPAVSGKLRLTPSSARLQADTRTRVKLAAQGATVQTRLTLDPVLGGLDHCDFLVTGAGSAPWQARFEKRSGRTAWVQRLTAREKLPMLLGLGDGSPLAPCLPAFPATVLAMENVQAWRLPFSPPLTQRETIILETACTPHGQHVWDVPLACVLDTPLRRGEVVLEPAGVALGIVSAYGLDLPAKNSQSLELRRLVQEPSLLPSLRVHAPPTEAVQARQEHIDHAHLQSYLLEDGRVFHHYSMWMANWQSREIVIEMDGAVRVLGAKAAGLWLQNVRVVPIANPPAAGQVGDALEVRLTIPAGMTSKAADVHTFLDGPKLGRIDLYYCSESSWPHWSSWSQFEAPWPRIRHVEPLARQRTWYLAPGLVPLRQDLWRDAFAPAGQESASRALVRKAWQIGNPLLYAAPKNTQEDARLRLAETDLRTSSAGAFSTFTLGEALEHLVFDHLKDRTLFVVDAASLAAAGIAPDTPVGKLQAGQPFWENLGLGTVTCSAGIILTTRQQAQIWKEARNLDQSVLQALTAGQDQQDVFCSVSYWLRHAPDRRGEVEFSFADSAAAVAANGIPHGLFADQPPPGWTVWQPRGGLPDEPALTVLRRADLPVFAWLLALVTLGLACLVRWALCGRAFFRGLAFWWTVWGLAFVWLPASLRSLTLGPLLVSLAFALGVYGILLVRGLPRLVRGGLSTQTMLKAPGSSVLPGLAVLLTLGTSMFLGPLSAAFQAPANVAKNDGGDSLRAGAFLVSAQYRGQVKEGNLVQFQAVFDVYNTADKSDLVLPLTKIDAKLDLLEGATWTDQSTGKKTPAYPSPIGQAAYVLPVAGKGWHRLTLEFVSQWTSVAEFQELRFGIPRLAQSQFHLTLPAKWQGVQIPQCQGDDGLPARAIAKGDKANLALHAQLGREDVVLVRWRQDNTPAPIAGLEVHELYLWDLRPESFSLTGLLDYTVARGTLNQVELTMPDNVEIRSVELGSATTAGARIKNWRLAGKDQNRRLQVDLTAPVAGKFQIVLNLVPRLALDAPVVPLKLPVPHVGKQQEGALAYRLDKRWHSTDKTQSLAITGIDVAQFAKEWRAAQKPDGVEKPPTRAYSFRRTPGTSQLLVNLQRVRPTIRQEVLCQVQPVFTDVTIRLHAQAEGEKISCLQCEVPGFMTLASVSGPAIHHWSRGNGRVQIWLAQPVAEARITLTGWVKNEVALDADRPGRFELPRVRPLPPVPTTTVIKIQPGPGCLVEPEKSGPLWARSSGLANLSQMPAAAGDDAADLVYQAQGPFYAGTFRIRPAAPRPEVRMLTTAGLDHGVFSFSTRIDCQLLPPFSTGAVKGPKREGRMTVTLRNWPAGADVRLDPLPLEMKHQYAGTDHVWHITVPPGELWPLTLHVHGQMPPGSKQTAIALPEVANADSRGHWLTWHGPAPPPGLTQVKDLSRIQGYWPAELSRLTPESTVWQLQPPGHPSRGRQGAVLALPHGRSSEHVMAWKGLWAEHELHLQEGRWLHQGNYLIAARAAAEVRVVLPPGAKLLAACWGEQFINPRQDDAQHIALQLSAEPAGLLLRLRWSYAPADEAALQPHLSAPKLVGANPNFASAGTTLWLPPNLTAPPSWHAGGAEPLLSRARGQMMLCSLLADFATQRGTAVPGRSDGTGIPSHDSGAWEARILAAQRLFYELLRHADHELLIAARLHPQKEKEQAAARAALQDLRKENADRARGKYDNLRLSALKTAYVPDPLHAPAALALPPDGLPLFGLGEADVSQPLRPADGETMTRAVFATQILLVACFAMLFLSFLPRLFYWLPRLWPEQLMLAAALGTLLLGWSILGTGLMLAALLARALWLGILLFRLANRFLARGMSH